MSGHDRRRASDPIDAYLAFEAARSTPREVDRSAHSPFEGADQAVHSRIAARIDALRPQLIELATSLYEQPETGWHEHKSVAKIAGLLRAEGSAPEVGAFGLDTAFRATAGAEDARPHFAIVAEYDALPEIGHACGHNIIAAVAAGAYLAVAPEIDVLGGGRLSIIGAPAEEGGGGKEHIIRAGGFDDIDAAGMVHPSVGNSVSPIYGSGTSGVRRLRVEYRGRAAHAALSPHLGLNALDAVVSAYQSIAQLRQHILPVDRIHMIITNGGTAANVVPDHASAEILVRSTEIDTLRALTDRITDILEAAAIATGTDAQIDADFEPPYLPLRTNVSLTKHWARHLARRGRIVPLVDATPRQGGPSTDMGNVSWFIPAVHPALGLGGAPGLVPHHADFAASTVQPPAFEALVDAAIALAGLAADYLADAGLRASVEVEFEAAGGRRRWPQ